MIIISHRRNTIKQITETPEEYGAEIDIRTNGNNLVIHHEPYEEGTCLMEWLAHYKHKLLILNVKEEGLESRLIEIMSEHNIVNYFFLDQSFPFLIKTSKQGERRSAVRFSEYESINTVLSLAGKVDWVWVDYFTRLAIDKTSYTELKKAGFKLCLVSPELQGFAKKVIPNLRNELKRKRISVNAVCTKSPDLWLNSIEEGEAC